MVTMWSDRLMDTLISLVVAITSQCIHTSNIKLPILNTYMQILFVNYTSINLEKPTFVYSSSTSYRCSLLTGRIITARAQARSRNTFSLYPPLVPWSMPKNSSLKFLRYNWIKSYMCNGTGMPKLFHPYHSK